MKICLVTEYFFPHFGGIPFHVYYLSKELSRRDHEVVILTSGDTTEKNVVTIGKGIPFYINGSIARVTLDPHLLKKIRLFFRNNQFDIIHIHGTPAPTLPYFALKYGRGKKVFTFHSYVENSLYYKIFKRHLGNLLNNVVKIAVSEAAVLCISKYIKGNYYIIPNGVDTSLYTPLKYKKKISAIPHLLFIGRFEPRKDVKCIIKALPFLIKNVGEVKISFVGTGPLLSLIKRKTSSYKNIEFLEKVTEKEKIEILRKSDLLLATSRRGESFGIVLIEGMATGTPVVASDISGYRCVISHKKNGLLFEKSNSRDLANKVGEILQKKDLYRKIRKNALIEVRKKYSWTRITDLVERVYDSGFP